jgi:hypothetical protein
MHKMVNGPGAQGRSNPDGQVIELWRSATGPGMNIKNGSKRYTKHKIHKMGTLMGRSSTDSAF